MKRFASFLDQRKARAAVVLALALHAVVLFGFAHVSRTGHGLVAIAEPVRGDLVYQPVTVLFDVAQVAAVAPATPPPPVRRTSPTTLVKPQMAAVQIPVPASVGATALNTAAQPDPRLDAPRAATEPAAVAADAAPRDGGKPSHTGLRLQDTRSDAHPVLAAKPDYAYNPQPDYPMLLREQGVGGVVWLRVWVDSEGHPGEIKLAKGSGYRMLDESALRAVRQWRFVPAQKGDQSLASWVEFPIRFTLNG